MDRLIERSLFTVPLIALLFLVACSDDSTGPGFTGPDVSGKWSGTWRGSAVVMTLDQDASNVTGTLMLGQEQYAIAGTVSSDGVFDWAGPATNLQNCVGMASVLDDFQLMADGNEMDGVASRAERSRGQDGVCGSRSYVQQGEMLLERSF